MTYRSRIISVIIHTLLITAVIATAVFVRSASYSFTKNDDSTVASLTDERGLPYLTDLDSYYHVRLVSRYIESGTLGDEVNDEGKQWDLHSYAPEGRSAEYQPGIIWITAALWKLTGSEPSMLPEIEYRIAAFVAALSALAAYIIGCRIGGGNACGMITGTVAAVLVSCAPQYALRTCYGRFDTDMFVVLMELLLILFLIEAVRASAIWQKILFTVLFALSAVCYSQCWAPKYATIFAGLTVAGGVVYLIAMITGRDTRPKDLRKAFASPSLWVVLGSGILTLAGIVLAVGPNIIENILSSLGFSRTSDTGNDVLPNLFASISELSDTSFLPRSLSNIFRGYVPSERPSVVNGIGGAAVMILAVAGLIWLITLCLPLKRSEERRDSIKISKEDLLLYACVLGTWFAACLFLMGYGVRFIEHLSIPAGLLAAVFLNLLIRTIKSSAPAKLHKKDKKDLILKYVLAGILCVLTVIPPVTGSAVAASDVRPSISQASVDAMQYIASNTGEDSLLASWWDMGYFYESCSDRPCLWDGGSQDSSRAILVAKALITDDMELSRRILLMLSEKGNAAIDMLMEQMPAKEAFDVLCKALVMDRDEAVQLLCASGLTEEDAATAEALIHPVKTHETYLIVTYTMTRQIGWYEYYANWDFTGSQKLPGATMYSYTPEGTPLFNTKDGQEYLNNVRGNELIWRLFFDAEQTPCFTPACESHDGIEHVRIWRVEE